MRIQLEQTPQQLQFWCTVNMIFFFREVESWGVKELKNLEEIKSVVHGAAGAFAPQYST